MIYFERNWIGLKKVCKWFALFIIIVSLILYMSKYFAYDLAINWKIYVPMVSKDKIIFTDFFQEGDVIRIISFSSKKKTQRFLNKYKFDVSSMLSESSGNYYYFKSKYQGKAFIIFIYDSNRDVFYLFESVIWFLINIRNCFVDEEKINNKVIKHIN